MGRGTKESMRSEGSTVSVLINGMTGHSTLANGKKIRYLVLVYILGLMAESMKESGSITTWRDSGSMCGTMDASMRGNTRMIKSMALAFIHGLTAGAMKATGGRENNMVLVHTLFPRRERLSMVYGKMERELNGLLKKMSQILI